MRRALLAALVLVTACSSGSGHDDRPGGAVGVTRRSTTSTTSTSSTTTSTTTTSATTTASAAPATPAQPATAPAPARPAPQAGAPPTAAPVCASCRLFPADSPWNQDISRLPLHPRSAAWVASVGLERNVHPDVGRQYGIPYVEVPANQPRVPITFEYADESDPGPYPIPPDAPIEGGSDRHILVLDRQSCRLWEVFAAETSDGGRSWRAGSGATWDLRSNALRPEGWTSADAAGLPILPGLIRHDEVAAGRIEHALRFTARRTQRAYISPARHYASSITDPDVPPMGARFRLRGDYDCGRFAPTARVVCVALQRYGMLLADNGSDWFVTGAPDPRWDDTALNQLKQIPGSAFEVVDTGGVR